MAFSAIDPPWAKDLPISRRERPYTFGSSDGLFNLGTAMAFVQTLGEGVYVAMNGRCWAWHAVRKDKKRGIFESVPGLRDT